MKATSNAQQTPGQVRFVTPQRVCDRFEWSRRKLDYTRRTDPRFPKAVRSGPAFNSSIRFVEHEIDAYAAALLAEREAQAPMFSEGGHKLSAHLKPEQRRENARRRKSPPATPAADSGTTPP